MYLLLPSLQLDLIQISDQLRFRLLEEPPLQQPLRPSSDAVAASKKRDSLRLASLAIAN
jgi:hypothetical protein